MSLPQNSPALKADSINKPAAPPDQWRRNLRRLVPYAPLIALVLLSILIGLANDRFLTISNWTRIAVTAAPVLVLAIGSTFVIILGSIDLSVEGVMALSTVLISLL